MCNYYIYEIDTNEKSDGPSLDDFEIKYNWRAVQEEDLSLGVGMMFTLTLLFLIIITCMVANTYEGDGNNQSQKSNRILSNAKLSPMKKEKFDYYE